MNIIDKIEKERITPDQMRLVFSGAADVLLTYALSDEFDWERDIEVLRPIAQGVEKLQAILDARDKQRQ